MSVWIVCAISFVGGLTFIFVCCAVGEWSEDRKIPRLRRSS